MARKPSPSGSHSLALALLLALASVWFSAVPGLADTPATPDPNATNVNAPADQGASLSAAAAEKDAEPTKPTHEQRGDAQSYLDARDGYAEAQSLYQSQEYAHTLTVLDENIATLN